MNRRRIFELLVDLPFLKKGTRFVMYDSTGHCYWIQDGDETQYLLRQGLQGYLWLLATEPGIMKLIENEAEYS